MEALTIVMPVTVLIPRENLNLQFESKLPLVLGRLNLNLLESQTKIRRSTWHSLKNNENLKMLDVRNLCALIGATRLPLCEYFEIYELVDGNRKNDRLGNCEIPESVPITIKSNLPSLLADRNLRQSHLVGNTKLKDSTVIKYYYGHFKRLEIEVVLTLLGFLECDFCQLFSFSGSQGG